VSWGGRNFRVGVGVSFAASATLYLHACLAFCFTVDVGFAISFNPTRICGTYGGATACLGFNPVSFTLRT
jgi:hypothetical protein